MNEAGNEARSITVGLPEGRGCFCIACRRELKNLMGDEGFQPVDGTAFSTSGHYGSTAFDPMDGSRLEIAVCDDCLRRAADDQIVAKQRIVTIHKTTTEIWNPAAEERWEIIEEIK